MSHFWSSQGKSHTLKKKENSPAGDILHPCTVWENQEANAIQRIICQNIGNVIVDEILVVRPKDSNCRAIHPQTDWVIILRGK